MSEIKKEDWDGFEDRHKPVLVNLAITPIDEKAYYAVLREHYKEMDENDVKYTISRGQYIKKWIEQEMAKNTARDTQAVFLEVMGMRLNLPEM